MSGGTWRTYQWKVIMQVEDVRERIGDRCFHCNTRGSKKNALEFAHLQPTALDGRGRGSHHRRLDLLKHLDKYTYLCHDCHKDFDGRNKKQIAPMSIADKLARVSDES